jgi:hypothetical protein
MTTTNTVEATNTAETPELFKIRASYRDLSCKGSGSQTYRRIVLPGHDTAEWPDCDRLPTLGGNRASERRCTTYMWVPEGTIIVDWTAEIRHYQKGRSDLSVGLVREDGHIEWLGYQRGIKNTISFEDDNGDRISIAI